MGSSLMQAKRKAALLAGFAKIGVLQPVLDKLKIDRSTYLRWKEEDPEFNLAFEQAKQQAIESLENEMVRRGRDGWLEPVYHKGEEVGVVRKFSDTLLIFALKGWAPDKYRERVDVNSQHVHLHAHRFFPTGEAESMGGPEIARLVGALSGSAGGEGVAPQGADGRASKKNS